MKRFLPTFCLVLFFLNNSFAQIIRYVREGGNGDGSAWQFASGDLQGMINASAPGDEVWVGEGIYKPTSWFNDPFNLNSNPVSRFSSFTIRPGVKLLGGFPATGNPGMVDRNPETLQSVLSGDIGETDSNSDNSFHVCFIPAADNFVLDGFTITGANANASTFSDYITTVSSINADVQNFKGGGIYITGGSGQILNCRIEDNLSEYEGAGCFIVNAAVQMTNNIFDGNESRAYGGAVYGRVSELSFAENLFTDNAVRPVVIYPFPMPHPGYYSSGGAVAGFNCDVQFTSNHFELNEARVNNGTTNANGGAIFLSNGEHIISNNVFINNLAAYVIGGVQVCNGGAIAIEQATAMIERNEFSDNQSHGSGGAVNLLLGTFHVNANRFNGNEAIGNGGAMLCSSSEVIATNNVFYLNVTGGFGGAIHSNYGSSPSFFVNNTFYANSSTSSQGAGGVSFDNAEGHIRNNIFYQNSKNGSTTSYGADFNFNSSGQSTFTYNMYQTGASGVGNIGIDGDNNPLFVDPENGNFALLAGSPCIDAGSNNHYLPEYEQTDFLGNNRMYNNTIDMGAIENQGQTVGVDAVDGRMELENIAIYPNPVLVNDVIHLLAKDDMSVRIIDSKGKLCTEKLLKRGANSIDLSLEAGIYFVVSPTGDVVRLVVL